MRFTWDEVKNTRNISKHGIDFRDVEDLFKHPLLMRLDQREDYGEERWTAIGWMKALLGVVVYVEKDGDEIRIISARKATKREVAYYEESLKN